jgi:hypothetical protein
MQLHDVESNVADLDLRQGFELIFDLLRAYGVASASITRLQKGTYDRAAGDDEVLWKGKVYYRFVSDGQDIHAAIDGARHDEAIARQHPRFIVVRNEDQIVAVDTQTGDTLDTPLADLPRFSAFFLPWAGIEKTQLESVNYADVKAAAKMARLYDEIVTHNRIETADDSHRLNVFFSRLLFCFFAEDTGVFGEGSFTNGIASLTSEDGSDTARYLDELFRVLDLPPEERKSVPAHFAEFGYVNGKLFAAQAASPEFSARARRLVLECGTLNWSVINPDIFGSMMQAVVHAAERESLGMHYTSVENIMKVIRPLFLDDLHQTFEAADTRRKLERLLERISEMKFLDPACGSGNFLVIAFKELRKLEHRILQRIEEIDPKAARRLFQFSRIKLEHFYGIEVDDFAHEIAILSLWLAKHQMNVEFRELFGVEISLIPLRDTGNVVCGNAARLNWEEMCPVVPGGEVCVMGNPPYRGAKLQSPENKADLGAVFGGAPYPRNLDYVSIWFLSGADYVKATGANLAFVATNSICQGEHVALLWPLVLRDGIEISFAYQSFLWSNQAKGQAGVTCIIAGLASSPVRHTLYADGGRRDVAHINAYLRPSSRDTIVMSRRTPIAPGLPPMGQGSRPNDGGHLTLSPSEREALIAEAPEAAPYIKRYMGSGDFLGGIERYCIWVPDTAADLIVRLPSMRQRFAQVAALRRESGQSARLVADVPHRFDFRVHQDGTSLIVPRVSSERRMYVPVGFLDGATVISDSAYAVYGAEAWVFALISSRAHNAWLRAVCGRLKSDVRYSATLCYNTFASPELSDGDKALLAERAFSVLEVRERHAHLTLAQMYDPDSMPDDLRVAHRSLDAVVDRLYRARPFESDDDRLELLFDMYEAAVARREQSREVVQVLNA